MIFDSILYPKGYKVIYKIDFPMMPIALVY
jgi:hypothetical protein